MKSSLLKFMFLSGLRIALICFIGFSSIAKADLEKPSVPATITEVIERFPLKIGQQVDPKRPCPEGYALERKVTTWTPFDVTYVCRASGASQLASRVFIQTLGDLIQVFAIIEFSSSLNPPKKLMELQGFAKMPLDAFNFKSLGHDLSVAEVDLPENGLFSSRAVFEVKDSGGVPEYVFDSFIFRSFVLNIEFAPSPEIAHCPKIPVLNADGRLELVDDSDGRCQIIAFIIGDLSAIIRNMGRKRLTLAEQNLLAKRAISFVKASEPEVRKRLALIPEAKRPEAEKWVNEWLRPALKEDTWKAIARRVAASL